MIDKKFELHTCWDHWVMSKLWANPIAGLRLEQLYGVPVLLSGMGALVLSRKELALINNHHKEAIQNLLRLKPGTPQVVCYFLAGTLPGEALIHLRQFSILSMIIDTKDNILHQHGLNVLTTNPSTRSWFHQIRNLCLLYQLPHPLTLLQGSHTRLSFRVLAKKHVLDYWEKKLKGKAVSLTSLIYFKSDFMSLMKPHPIFSSAGFHPMK